MSEGVTVPSLTMMTNSFREIACEAHTHTDRHGLGSTVKFAKSLTTLQTRKHQQCDQVHESNNHTKFDFRLDKNLLRKQMFACLCDLGILLRIHRVQENVSIKVVPWLAGQPDTDHYRLTFFMRVKDKITQLCIVVH